MSGPEVRERYKGIGNKANCAFLARPIFYSLFLFFRKSQEKHLIPYTLYRTDLHGSQCTIRAGSRIENVAPTPGVADALIVPLYLSIIFLAIAKPIPRPSYKSRL